MKVTCNCILLCYGEESFSDMIVCFYLDILFSYLKTNKQLNKEEIFQLIRWKKDQQCSCSTYLKYCDIQLLHCYKTFCVLRNTKEPLCESKNNVDSWVTFQIPLDNKKYQYHMIKEILLLEIKWSVAVFSILRFNCVWFFKFTIHSTNKQNNICNFFFLLCLCWLSNVQSNYMLWLLNGCQQKGLLFIVII